METLAVNGIGRIGKLVVKLLVQNQYNLTHLNEINGNTHSLINSIEFDSFHGKWQANIENGKDEIKIDGKSIKATFVENINDLSLDDVDIMIDCTGVYKSSSKLQKYFDKGVKKVIVSAPINEDNIVNIAYGVNHNIYKPKEHNIITGASCTTNCIAQLLKFT